MRWCLRFLPPCQKWDLPIERSIMKLKKLWPVGRADVLFFALLGLGFALLLLGVWLFNIWVVSSAALPLGYCIFRLFSHNLGARRKEDTVFRDACAFCHGKMKKAVDSLSYDEENTFRICPDCGAKLCYEERQGIFYITCPQCGCRFLVDLS